MRARVLAAGWLALAFTPDVAVACTQSAELVVPGANAPGDARVWVLGATPGAVVYVMGPYGTIQGDQFPLSSEGRSAVMWVPSQQMPRGTEAWAEVPTQGLVDAWVVDQRWSDAAPRAEVTPLAVPGGMCFGTPTVDLSLSAASQPTAVSVFEVQVAKKSNFNNVDTFYEPQHVYYEVSLNNPGRQYWVRARAVGWDGVPGPWSEAQAFSWGEVEDEPRPEDLEDEWRDTGYRDDHRFQLIYCGCATGAEPIGGAWVLGLAALLGMRRRS